MVSYTPLNPAEEVGYALVLLVYVLAVVGITKILYDMMRRRGLPHNVAVYYNRKVIHIFAGGVAALLVPELFTTPTIPLVLALLLTVLVYIPHRTGKLMYWFQVEDNMFEVNFTLMWGLAVFLLWALFQNPYIAIVPPAFMAFGDAATGVARNALFKRRTKHWVGNIAMAAVTIPLGYMYAGVPGTLAGVLASFVERYEFPPIDDNVLITLVSIAVLMVWYA